MRSLYCVFALLLMLWGVLLAWAEGGKQPLC
ncbi:MAG: hypothetical protein KatS3mg022_0768 [Armatimonadota bacterium]|nr:MAG: hypothetical protein KatS3mg022_0768 [Armatimonadota bacterium]